MKQIHSDYWLGDHASNLLQSKTLSPVELASYVRSISNFVKILTGKSIPVTYKSKEGSSFTDGVSVTISSKLNSSVFDSIVGLALHEASHILLTDFNMLSHWSSSVNYALSSGNYDHTQYDSYDRTRLQSLLNYVEDRRIDRYVISTTPGYKEYYTALYDRYFNSKLIDKLLVSDEFMMVDWDSYMFRLINFTNKNRDLDALPNLRNLYNKIFDNIKNLSSTADSLKLAIELYDTIHTLIKNHVQVDSNDGGGDGGGESDNGNSSTVGGGGRPSIGDGDGDAVINVDASNSANTGSHSENESSDTDSHKPRVQLSDYQKKQIPKLIRKQDRFLKGDMHKSGVSKEMSTMIDSLVHVDSSIKDIDIMKNTDTENPDVVGIKTVILRGLNAHALQITGCVSGVPDNDTINSSRNFNIIQQGIVLGKRLGKKLQIRNYEKLTDLNRQPRGRLDKRRIHSIGVGDVDIFKKTIVEKHTNAFLHISIDLSSSMYGIRYREALMSAVAIIQMGEMTNIDVQVSMRLGSPRLGIQHPIMWIVYDSRTDRISKIKKYLSLINPIGITPEGLCFDAIMSELPVGNHALKTYFINFSDGQPNYLHYSGTVAERHTRKQVDKLIKNGYTVLSFFLTDNGDTSSEPAFKRMYGSHATTTNPTELKNLSKQLQKMFEKL